MLNLSPLSKIFIFTIIAIITSALILYFLFVDASKELLIYAFGVQSVLIFLILLNAFFTKIFLNKLTAVGSSVSQGDFNKRLVMPSIRGDMRVAAIKINAMIDINDAFVREASLALTAASEGRFYRKIYTTGMQGMYCESVNKINDAIDLMDRATKERAMVVNELQNKIGVSVEAAIAGDFTKRMKI